MRVPVRLLALLGVTLFTAIPLAAQRMGPVEKKPKLPAGSDTLEANVYLAYGDRVLKDDPEEAARAFYWAGRLDPSSADALYGRRIAMLMRKPTVLAGYMNETRRSRDAKTYRAIDTLQLRAVRLNPFVYRRHDRTMLLAYFRSYIRSRGTDLSAAELDDAIIDYLNDSDPATRAWLAYSQGRLDDAIKQYDLAIKRSKNAGYLRIEKARVHATMGILPPAIQEFSLAVKDLRAREEKKDEEVVFYDSKALAEHSIGLLQEKMGRPDSAKAALGRAIAEDISYFPAHVTLGLMALLAKDTTTAVAELGLAAELAPDEPYVHFLHGWTLLSTGDHAAALTSLRKAAELEPVYAAPHFAIGQALERAGDAAGARVSYEKFISMSSRRDRSRDIATQRLAALAGK